jgi:hypothetical protein
LPAGQRVGVVVGSGVEVEPPALGVQRVVEQLADLLQRAVEPARAAQLLAPAAGTLQQIVQAAGRCPVSGSRIPRRSRSRSASPKDRPSRTSRPSASTAARTSYGGASGSPPCQTPYRYRLTPPPRGEHGVARPHPGDRGGGIP